MLRVGQLGMSLVELMVGIAIVAILLALAAPNYIIWVENAKIRTTAEAIQTGMRLARSEAIRRNALIRFQLMDNVTNACQISATGSSWVVSFDDPTAGCAGAMLNEAFEASDATNNPPPRMIQVRSGEEGSQRVDVVATQAGPVQYVGPITFNGLGRNVTPAAQVAIDVSNSGAGPCATIGGNEQIRCLRVIVSAGGQIRMCDPARPAPDPAGC